MPQSVVECFCHPQGIPATSEVVSGEGLTDLRGIVECEEPNRHLYDFVGNIRLSGKR